MRYEARTAKHRPLGLKRAEIGLGKPWLPEHADRANRERHAVGTVASPLRDHSDHKLAQRWSSDNGPEFISRALDHWAYINRVTLDFSGPGKPTDNAFVESFNGRLRDECLNTHWFLSLDDARSKIEAWRTDFNETRPHTSLGFMTPAEFASSAGVNPGR